MNFYSLYDTMAPMRVLIVDDFPQFRQTLRAMLFRLGVQKVDQAANGVEAIRMAMENEYDIIFCDYNLGDGQDGQHILEELHERDIMHKGMLFLMVTAETASIQVVAAIEYRPDAYLTKPFTGEQLGQRLKRLTEKQQILKPLYQAINSKAYDQALELCDSITEQHPTTRFSCLRLKTEVLEIQKKYEEAQVIYKAVVDEQPLLWAVLGIGRVVYLQGNLDTALQLFLKMKADFPQQVSVLDWIARCQRELDDLEAAKTTLQEAITISPKSVRRQEALGQAALALDQVDEAQKAFEKTVTIGRGSCLAKPEHYQQYFETTKAAAGNYDDREKNRLLARIEAISKQMERKYRDDPGAMAAGFSALASLYSDNGRTSLAQASLSKLSKTLQDPDSRISQQDFEQVQSHLQQLNGDALDTRMLEQLDTELKHRGEQIKQHQQQDESAQSVNAEGLKLAKQRQPELALEQFRKAVSLAPHNHNYMLNAAQIILLTEALKEQPDLFTEACRYLDGLNLENSGNRWRIYKKLTGMIANE